MLSVDQLTISARYGNRQPLLRALSFTVNPCEAVALIGPSGCGKTTLLRSIAGLIDPISGTITIDGQSAIDLGWPTFRSKAMLVPQRPVVWDTTVCDNLLRPMTFRAIKHTCLAGAAGAMLGSVGLEHKLDAKATELSEGERQRVCLVRALLAEPDFLLLDEPTSALDEASVRSVESLLSSSMEAGTGPGVLVATHDREFANRFCSRLIDLSDSVVPSQAVANA